MKIIDFDRHGNQVKFYVGSDYCENYYGDDWNDRPYEHNAGRVYDEFVTGWFVKTFDFDDVVMEPCCGHDNSNFCKDDMREGKVPCIVVLPKEHADHDAWYYDFEDISGNKKAIKYYFNDKVDENEENIHYIKTKNNEDFYINFCLDGVSFENAGVVHLATEMFSKSLEYMTENIFEKEDVLKKLEAFIENDAEKQFKEFLKISSKILDIKFTTKLKKVITNSRQVCRAGELNVSICYLSDDKFKIGKTDYNWNRKYEYIS